MRRLGIQPNEYTFVAVLTACARVLDLELGSQAHCLAIKLGFLEDIYILNALMGFYSKCGYLDFVLQVFDEMLQRDISSWGLDEFFLQICNKFPYSWNPVYKFHKFSEQSY
ncbi:hypothetical protein L2E82_08722 [Cichorium intybus]|uniref:Uncharacterized protein n=1 Tax=Cichorium intybus TaxID=13427 RepID=A0ACB9G7V1_CICIN|nr:hypothetical protein L2E82_08722 [Cichorium intybus]